MRHNSNMRLFFIQAFAAMFLRAFGEDLTLRLFNQIKLAMCEARCYEEQIKLDLSSAALCENVNETAMNSTCTCGSNEDCSHFCNCFQDDIIQDIPSLSLTSPQMVCKDLSSNNDTESTLFLKWTLANETKEWTSIMYVLEISSCNKQNWNFLGKGPYDFVPITGLQRNSSFQFRVRAVSSEGYVGPSMESDCFTTLTDYNPSQPVNISVEKTFFTDGALTHRPFLLSAEIKWIPPSTLPCYYEVMWYEETLDLTYQLLKITPESPSLNQVIIDKLRLGTNYTVIVRSGLDEMKYESKKAHLWFITENCTQIFGYNFSVCPPSPPVDVQYQILSKTKGNLTVSLTWKPPANASPDNPIEQYRIKLRKQISFVSGSLTAPFFQEYQVPGNILQLVIGDLEPDSYEFSVTAVSPGGDSDAERTKTIIQGSLQDDAAVSTDTLWVLLPSLFVASALIVGIFLIYRYHRNQKQKKARNRYFESLEEVAPAAEDELTLEDLKDNEYFHELDLTYFRLGEILGQGAFGIVRKAKIKCHNTWETVAIKMLKPSASEDDRRQLLQEIDILRSVGQHPHIISFIGCCRKGTQLFVAVEHCPLGDLQTYLRRFRQQYLTVAPLYQSDGSVGVKNDSGFANNWSGIPYTTQSALEPLRTPSVSSGDKMDHFYQNIYHQTSQVSSPVKSVAEPLINPIDLLSFSRQIALGMEYLSKNKLIHRDLATRNILVCENKIVKISDFGLSRDVYENNIYNKLTAGRLPVKWMAYESLFDHTYTTKSDVWSFGVVLWELGTLGGTPYPGVSNEELFKLLRTGYRMEKPDNCSDDVYALMRACWQDRPTMRPSFTELRMRLDALLEDSVQYITFDVDANAQYYNTSSPDLRRTKMGTNEDDSAFEEGQ